jgi:hypothetical protein
MKRKYLAPIIAAAVIAMALALAGCAQNADRFAVLAKGNVSTVGTATISGGDVGSDTGTITGFTAEMVSDGATRTADASTAAGITELQQEYTTYGDSTATTATIPAELAGQTLPAGVYDSADATFTLNGDFTFNGESLTTTKSADASGGVLTTTLYGPVFRSAGDFVVGAGSNVNSSDTTGAPLFFVGGNTTIGDGSNITGSIVSTGDITVGDDVTVSGRLYSLNGNIVLGDNDSVDDSVAVSMLSTSTTTPTVTPTLPKTDVGPTITTNWVLGGLLLFIAVALAVLAVRIYRRSGTVTTSNEDDAPKN